MLLFGQQSFDMGNRILIYDDDKDILVTSAILEMKGYE